MKMTRTETAVALGLGALALRMLRSASGYSFAGRSVVITGGSRGLGLVLARELADEGARLTILARDANEVQRAAEDLAGRGAQVLPLRADVRDQAIAGRAVERAVERFGGIDVLINNAGVIAAGPIEHMTTEDFAEAMAVHFWGPLHMTMAALPQMRRAGGGRIVNISSIGGRVAVPHLVPYCASKFALVGLSDGMRAELAKDGILVTTVTPGLMRTGSHVNALFKGQHEREYAWFSLLDSLPITSIDARRAARQIIEACRAGRPSLTVSIQAQAIQYLSALFPELAAEVTRMMDRRGTSSRPAGRAAPSSRHHASPASPTRRRWRTTGSRGMLRSPSRRARGAGGGCQLRYRAAPTRAVPSDAIAEFCEPGDRCAHARRAIRASRTVAIMPGAISRMGLRWPDMCCTNEHLRGFARGGVFPEPNAPGGGEHGTATRTEHPGAARERHSARWRGAAPGVRYARTDRGTPVGRVWAGRPGGLSPGEPRPASAPLAASAARLPRISPRARRGAPRARGERWYESCKQVRITGERLASREAARDGWSAW
jgi:NAD(P)-dependent dehydrogenase (short-subunit alcohol dehydrogenase family)